MHRVMLPTRKTILLSLILQIVLPLLDTSSFGSEVTAIRAAKAAAFSERVALFAEGVTWARTPLNAIRLAALDFGALSKAEVISLLIEKAIIENRISPAKEIVLMRAAIALEDGEKILLKFLQSDCREFREFQKTFRLVQGGDSSLLGKLISRPIGGDWAAHHIVPSELREHWALEKIGFNLDEAANGIALPTKPNVSPTLPLHSGSHPGYTEAVNKALDEIPRNLSESETRKVVESIQQKFRNRIESGLTEAQLHEKFGGVWDWPFKD
jgi:A nuclease family of the HNH/ENDO VII superfamily with conserved AHH